MNYYLGILAPTEQQHILLLLGYMLYRYILLAQPVMHISMNELISMQTVSLDLNSMK